MRQPWKVHATPASRSAPAPPTRVSISRSESLPSAAADITSAPPTDVVPKPETVCQMDGFWFTLKGWARRAGAERPFCRPHCPARRTITTTIALYSSVMTQPEPSRPEVIVTTSDATRLQGLIGTRVGLAYRLEARRLRDELRRARVVEPQAVPATLVTMNSKVRYADLLTNEVKEVTLVYPWHAQGPTALSILSAVGTALFGMRIGDTVEWVLDDLSRRTFRILAVPYQPEAAGHWHL